MAPPKGGVILDCHRLFVEYPGKIGIYDRFCRSVATGYASILLQLRSDMLNLTGVNFRVMEDACQFSTSGLFKTCMHQASCNEFTEIALMKTTPSQQRSINRVAEILNAAEDLIQELPIDDITSTMIAKRANVTRTSLYHFFPSKFDIYEALSKKYRTELKQQVIKFFDPEQQSDYREAWDGISGVFSRFFNRNPTAAILLLGRKASRQIRYTDEAGSKGFAKELGKLMREHTDLQMYAADTDVSGDIFQIVLELLTATFAYGMRREGRISKKTREEAKAATLAYINTCLEAEAS